AQVTLEGRAVGGGGGAEDEVGVVGSAATEVEADGALRDFEGLADAADEPPAELVAGAEEQARLHAAEGDFGQFPGKLLEDDGAGQDATPISWPFLFGRSPSVSQEIVKPP